MTEEERVRLAVSFREKLRACEKCPLHTEGPVVPWHGDLDPTYAIMGEAPGADEVEQGKPFVGRAGRKLRQMLRQVGIDDTAVTYLNSVQHRPPLNRDPSPEELSACHSWVTGTLDFVQPKVLITVGRIAYHQILGRRKPMIANMHGKPLYLPNNGARWMPTYHPSAALRPGGKKYADMILEDLAQVKTWTDDMLATGNTWPELPDCYVCENEIERYDEFGIGYCERHAKIQGNLF